MATHVTKSPISPVMGDRSRSDDAEPRGGSKVKRFFVQLGHEVVNDQIDNVGAMMAYYAILALFPMLVFISTIESLVLDYDTIQQGIDMATSTMPAGTRELIT